MTVKVKSGEPDQNIRPHPKTVLAKVKKGVPKNKIPEETGHTVGIYDVSIKDIDRTRVLQAKNIMFKTSALVYLKDAPWWR